MPQSVEHKHIGSSDSGEGFLGYKVGVGDVGYVTHPKTQHREIHVHYWKGNKLNACGFEGFSANRIQGQIRCSRVAVFVEAIVKFPSDGLLNLYCGVYLRSRLLSVIEGPHIIQTGYMVFVGMGEDYRIEAANAQEREAYANEEYRQLLAGLSEAIETEETLRWKLEAARIAVEVWRSEQATARLQNRATE